MASTLKWEGGYVNHPKDPGGATNKGVTQARYNEYRCDNGLPKRAVKSLTEGELQDIYRHYYWNVVKGDRLPLGLDLAVFDFAVNSGPSRSAKYLQRMVGVSTDGKIGPKTLQAVEGMNIPYVIQALCDERAEFVRGLSIYSTFGRGWENRINDIKKTALSMSKRITSAPSVEKPKKSLFDLLSSLFKWIFS